MSAPMPAFRVTYDDGLSYVTSMAVGVTLAMARAYFMGQRIERQEGEPLHEIVAVEQID